MGVTINVNNLSLCHKASGGMTMATIPDVCLTPTPAGPVPIPYPNIAMSSDLTDGTTTIEVDGGNMAANYGSQFCKSTGDEPGVNGGVASGTFIKEATWITFSFDVKMEGKAACRLTDKMFHNHQNTVNMAGEIQGPVTVVKVDPKKACEDAAKGRKSGSTQQTYENCGVESARQLINSATNANISEDDLLSDAIKNGDAEFISPSLDASGGTTTKQQKDILNSHGVPSSAPSQSMGGIEAAVSEGRGVIAQVDPGLLWSDPEYVGSGHAVLVTGLVKDADGKVTEVIINDTGQGDCGKPYPADVFEKSLLPDDRMVTTDKPIW